MIPAILIIAPMLAAIVAGLMIDHDANTPQPPSNGETRWTT